MEAQAQGMMLRQDVQFHWQNPGYRDFDEFLSTLSRDKRKRIKQERRKVKEAGIELQCVTGHNATAEQWAFFASCYLHTLRLHNSPHQLNADFFQRIGAAMPQHTLLVIATREGRPIASALNYVDRRGFVRALMGYVRIPLRTAFRDLLLLRRSSFASRTTSKHLKEAHRASTNWRAGFCRLPPVLHTGWRIRSLRKLWKII